MLALSFYSFKCSTFNSKNNDNINNYYKTVLSTITGQMITCLELNILKKNIQLNFVKVNFIKTNNSLRRSVGSVPNRVLLILTQIQLFKSKYLCRTFCVEAYFAVLKRRFLHNIKWLSRTAVSQFSHLG